jgi:alkylated DNA repair dioxygenase AlkB
LEAFVRRTPLARIAAELLGSPAAILYHDHVLIKEPGTQAETPYHQDEPYYDVLGDGVSFWIPVDPVAAEESLEVFAGTHKGPLYLPRTFLSKEAKWHAPGTLPETPDFDPSAALRWALAPGDAIAFSFKAVHGAAGVRAAAPRRRVYSLRFVAHDTVHAPRPWRTSPQLSDALRPGEADERVAGAPLRGVMFPALFSAPVDAARYPLHARGGELAALVARCRAAYEAEGAAVLPGFLAPEALAAMAAEAEALQGAAFVSTAGHNVYQDGGDPGLPAEHPRNARVRTVVASIANDQLPHASPLRALYEWLPLREFVRQVVGAEALFPLDCPIGACTVNVFRPGMEQGWHFDEAEFSVTLMLTGADAGGHFDFAKGLREAGRVGGAEEAAAIGALMAGGAEGLRRLPIVPGTLSIFRGHTALHRVTPVEGSRTRLVAVLTFNRAPGVKNSPAVTTCFWGRREPLPNTAKKNK